jgi:hypothetical protein
MVLLEHISADPRIVTDISEDNVKGLWVLVSILYGWASDNLEKDQRKRSERGVAFGSDDHSKRVGACVQACRLIEQFAYLCPLQRQRLPALAQFWPGMALNLLPGNEEEVLQTFHAALAELRIPPVASAMCMTF